MIVPDVVAARAARAYPSGKLTKHCPKCGRTVDAPGRCACSEALAPGTVLAGRYLIVRVAGRGAAATVYHALDRMLDEPVALKVLDAAGAGAAAVDRFRAEIKLARRVTHPNVCRIHDYGEDGDRRFICMELIDGRNLRDVLADRGRLASGEACAVALQAAAALEAIHARGIVHRDVKTANLIQDAAGRVYVTDFGVATGGGPGSAGLAAGYVAGTPEYMSPEQAQGLRLDPRSDLYALGVVLFELLTGDVPFRGGSTAETLVRHVQQPLPIDALAAADVPEGVRALVERLLAKHRDDRPPSAADAAEALRPFARPDVVPLPSRQGMRTTFVSKTLTLRRPSTRAVARVAAAAIAVALTAGLRQGLSPFPPSTETTPAWVAATRTDPRPATVTVKARSVRSRRRALPAVAAPMASAVIRAASVPDAPGAEAFDAEELVAALPLGAALPLDPQRAPAPPPAAVGHLQLGIAPWAEVAVDGVAVGTTPLAPVALSPGTYTARLVHPDFRPFVRKVTIRPGQTTPLRVDLRLDGIRNR
jgi:serine/threonine protein kinase